MDFPKRIKQHKAQSDSFAILLYRLRDLGIFRNVTENDYGIDFEIEIVDNERVLGRYLKAQVKSAETVRIRKDNTPVISGLKISTLNYWAELSFRSHVIVFAVNLSTEKIYFTNSIFWQATWLIDNSGSTKTIEFRRPIDFPSSFTKDDTKFKEETDSFVSGLFIKQIAFDSSISDIIYAHKTLLRNIKSIFELYTDIWHYDAWCEVLQEDIFKIILECAGILIGSYLPSKIEGLEEEDKTYMFSFDYWAHKAGWSYEGVSNQVAKTPLKAIFPLMLDRMQHYSEYVLKGAYYWFYKDVTYLKLVHKTVIPSTREHEKLIQVNYDNTNFKSKTSFESYLLGLEKKHNMDIK